MAHIVKCRICKQQMDTDKMAPDTWVMPSPKFYYHKNCYTEWKENKNNVKARGKDEAFWLESLIDYLYRDIKMDIDFSKLNSQWSHFTKPGRDMTPKGVYFAVRYYYDILHGDKGKAQGGIGIVANIYNDSAQYWIDLENRKTGTIESIITQIQQRDTRPVQIITKKNTSTKDKSRYSINDI